MSVEILDRLDSLDGWVAVKEDPFNDPILPPRLTFLVSWNDIERKVAVTCRLRSRVVSDSVEHHGRSSLFTFQEIQGIHEMLCLVHPGLSPYLPELPEEPRGLWSFLSAPETPHDVDTVCRMLEDYFPFALETCKEKLLMSTLFEEHSPDDYFENISEFKKQLYEETINNAHDKLNNVLFLRNNSSNMHDMREVYELEDEAVDKLTLALSEMYNYQLQPFLDIRELAYSKLTEAKRQLQNPDIGDRLKREHAAKFTEWQGHYEQALDSIQTLYVKYYTQTCDIYKGMLIRITEDQTKYGKTSFEMIGGERLLRIQEDLSSEKLQLLQNVRKQYVQERDKVKEEIASLDEGAGTKKVLDSLEAKVFTWQVKVYKVQLKILDEEEKMARSQLYMITQHIQDEEEKIVFYDAMEDLTEVSPDEESQDSRMITDPQLRSIRERLISIQRRRAKIRNLKAALERQFHGKEQQKIEDIEKWKQHHAIQTKLTIKKDEEIRKSDFIQEERKKTVERLKTFKVKHPAPAAIKPPRYQPPSLRRATKIQNKGQKDMSKGKSKQGTLPSGPSGDSHVTRRPSPLPRQSVKKTDDIPVTIYVKGGVQDPNNECSNVPPPPPPPPIPACPPPPPPPPPPPLPPPIPSTPETNILKKAEKNIEQVITSNRSVAKQSGTPELDDILSSRQKLKPVSDDEKLKKATNKDPMSEVLDMIKNGVKLRCVKKEKQEEEKESALVTPSDQHLKLLQESLNRINRFTRDSSPDSDSDEDFED